KALRQEDRCSQIGVEMRRPALRRHRARLVRLEARGIVDETGEAAERMRSFIDEPLRGLVLREVAAHDDGPASIHFDSLGERLGIFDRLVAMDRDRPPLLREVNCEPPPNAARRTGDQYRALRNLR